MWSPWSSKRLELGPSHEEKVSEDHDMRRLYCSVLNAGLVSALALGTSACGEKDDDSSDGGAVDGQDDGGDTDGDDGGEDGDDGGEDGDDGGDTGDDGGDTGGDGGDDGGDGDSGGAFIEAPDSGDLGQCDPGAQDCPNEDEKCTAYVTEPGYCCVDANKCVPVIGDKQFGDPCTRSEDNDDCDKGYFCMTKTSGDTGDGVCYEFCIPNTPDQCLDGGGTCIPFNDGVLPMCQTTCDPLVQDCPPEMGCYAAYDNFVCARPGVDDGKGNDGDDCYTIQSCLPGNVCVGAGSLEGCTGDRCCTPICDLSMADPCTAPETCTAWFEEGSAPPGLEDVGVCVIPP
jgi:hypothetical protein